VARLSKPRRRGYGRGSVSIQRGAYVATYKDLKTGRPVRRSFPTDEEAQVYLDEWYAEKRRQELDAERERQEPSPEAEHSLARYQRSTPRPGTFAELI
jgi:hypothetical protein